MDDVTEAMSRLQAAVDRVTAGSEYAEATAAAVGKANSDLCDRVFCLETALAKMLRVLSSPDVFTKGDAADRLELPEPFNREGVTQGDQARAAWKSLTEDLPLPAMLRPEVLP